MSKSRIKKTTIKPAANQGEAEQLIAEIGRLQREVERIEADMNDELAAIKARHEQAAQPHNAGIEALFQRVYLWAEANREGLLKGRAKTAKLATGDIAWRTTPPAVRITGVELVMDRLKSLGLAYLIRTKEEPNKEAILADAAAVEGIKGISITQREEFTVRPFSSEIERSEPVRKVAA